MQKMRFFFTLLSIILPFVCLGQTKAESAFISFVEHKIIIPDDIKYNCQWSYAIVVAETDNQNNIVKIQFMNDVSSNLKTNFNVLKGYHFPVSYKVGRQAVIFYFSVDNREICKAQNADFTYVFPNDVLLKIAGDLGEARKKFPNAIFIAEPVLKILYETQH